MALCALCMCACSARVQPKPLATTVERLADAVAGLAVGVAREEAERVAWEATRAAQELTRDYRLVRPPLLHNLFVNTGLRERGLCCHFAEDLLARLRALDLETLDLRWAVSKHGSLLREHSSVLVVPRGGAFGEGLVLDAWRESGQLRWARAADDRYAWKAHPLDGSGSLLHCR